MRRVLRCYKSIRTTKTHVQHRGDAASSWGCSLSVHAMTPPATHYTINLTSPTRPLREAHSLCLLLSILVTTVERLVDPFSLRPFC
jgi:hypothetical protein